MTTETVPADTARARAFDRRVARALTAEPPKTMNAQEALACFVLSRHGLASFRAAGAVVRAARGLRAVAERMCNGYAQEKDSARDWRRVDFLRAVVREATPAGLRVVFSNDPQCVVAWTPVGERGPRVVERGFRAISL